MCQNPEITVAGEGKIAYQYLEKCPHPWRQQLSVKGRNMTTWQLVRSMLAYGETPVEAAKNRDLPLEAVAEALLYCIENWELVQAEQQEEKKDLVEAGLLRE